MTARTLFVAGSHTEIGKTHAACGLLRAAREEGVKVDALKPVVSGFDETAWEASDPGRLLVAMEAGLIETQLARICPWRFAAPLAPPMAAELEDRALPMGPIVDFCRARIEQSPAELLVIEGVGGLMSPIAEGATTLDLLEALAGWSVLVGGSYLGAVSHTLTALEVMRARGLAPAAVLVSEDANPEAPDFIRTVTLISEHAEPAPVIPMSRHAGYAWAGLALRALDLLSR